jgi:tetratricopeptide (TPR) repeat protein
MTRLYMGKSWVKNLLGTVTGSVAVFLVQHYLGLSFGTPDACPEHNILPEPQALKVEASRFYTRALESGRQGRYAEAVAEYTEALRLDPTFGSAYLNRAWTLGQLGHFERMAADCTEAAGLDRSSALAYANRGWAYANLARYDLAVQDCTEAMRLDPTLTQAAATRSWALARLSTPVSGKPWRP